MNASSNTPAGDATAEPQAPARPRAGGRLPSGRHGLPRAFVVENQRQRILDALASAVAEKGYARTTVADVIGIAGVSRKTFYEQFSDKNDCFLAAYDEAVKQLYTGVEAAYRAKERWPTAVIAAIEAFLIGLSAEPEFARMALVEVIRASDEALDRYYAASHRFAGLLDEGRDESPFADDLPESTAQSLIGGIAAVIVERLRSGQSDVRDLLPAMATFALIPYIGVEAAKTEVEAALEERAARA
jgi:AcrR family transcriptional regulator